MRFRKTSFSTLILLVIVFACLSMQTRAQKAVASLDTTSIRLGEQVRLNLNVTLPKAARVIWPAFNDSTFESVEILGATKVDTIETNRNTYLQYKQSLIITSFDSGYQTIPQIEFQYTVAGDNRAQSILTDSLILHVRTVEVDTTKAIRDIKAPMQAPITLEELWPLFAGVAVIGLIVGFVWYYMWRRKQRKPFFPVIRKAQLPPWQTAIEALNEIESRKLWQHGKTKEYYTEITDVLRTYLEQQHQIQAMEMISTEIIEALDQHEILRGSKDKVWQILQLADLVKFAKEMPLPAENDLSLANAKGFINDTKPAENKEKNTDQPENTVEKAEE